MTKCCPIMSRRENTYGEVDCIKSNCALCDHIEEQCCLKTMALAAADKRNGGQSPTAQGYYIPPSSYCHSNTTSPIYSEADLINNPVCSGGMCDCG